MKAKVTISRSRDGTVRITFRDDASGIEFAEVSIPVEKFGDVITGLAEQECDLSVRGLQWVGMKRVSEAREIKCPLKSYSRETLSKWLEENAQEDGWMVNTYLGSQSSVQHVEDGTILRYRVTKYVDQND